MTVSTVLATAPANGCRLVTPDGRLLPLRSTEVDADAGGGLARVSLRQVFHNAFAEPLAVTYRLPLPADGAVVGFWFTVAGVRTVGRVDRKADARAAFEQAILEGRTAAILEQERSSVFTQELGNVPPGAEVVVGIEVEQPLAWAAGSWEWRWPTVIGPRYLGAPGSVPDGDRVTVDVDLANAPASCAATLRIADPTTGRPASPSHPLSDEGRSVRITGALDRDLVVRWPVATPGPQLALETARPDGGGDAFALLTLVPPALAAAAVRRDLCLLLDTSGSMGGRPLAQLAAFSTALVAGLRDGDVLEMIEFSSSARRWRPGVVTVDARTRADALGWIGRLRAGGGTEMASAVTSALASLSAESQRQVVLMTDGYIGAEVQVIGRVRKDLPPASRIHVVGVGSSVNRTLTGGVARAGGGVEVIVGLDEATDAGVAALLARTSDPQWVGVEVGGDVVREVATATIPDLMAGTPARVWLRIDPAGGHLTLRARTPSGTMERTVTVPPTAAGAGRRVLATAFARERVEDLENAVAGGASAAEADRAIEALGLRHQIATRLTSWVAVSAAVAVDPSDPTRRVTQPVALPYGIVAEDVGMAVDRLGATAASMAPMPPPPPQKADASRRRSPSAPGPGGAAPHRPAPALRAKEAEETKAKKVAAPRQERMDAKFEVAEEGAMSAPQGPLTARVVSTADGRLVLEVTLDEDTDWDATTFEVEDAAAATSTASGAPGTTRAGRVSAGATVRLVFAWSGPLPRLLRVAGRAVLVA